MGQVKIGDRVTFSRNGFDGFGIVVEIQDGEAKIAVNCPLGVPQTFAFFATNECKISNI